MGAWNLGFISRTEVKLYADFVSIQFKTIAGHTFIFHYERYRSNQSNYLAVNWMSAVQIELGYVSLFIDIFDIFIGCLDF